MFRQFFLEVRNLVVSAETEAIVRFLNSQTGEVLGSVEFRDFATAEICVRRNERARSYYKDDGTRIVLQRYRRIGGS